VCSEPLDANTANGGQPFLDQERLDLDDSPDATECHQGAESLYAAAKDFSAVPASEQPLPPGHSLGWVLRKEGGGVSFLAAPDIDEPSDTTYCQRTYQRWDPNAVLPIQSANEQYKVMTSGGWDPEGNANPIQISTATGQIGTRFDGSWFNSPVDFQTLGHVDECRNNFCRFELCWDHHADGIAQARFRMAVLAPNPNAGRTYEAVKPPGVNARTRSIFKDANWPLIWYTQLPSGANATRFATHAIVAKRSPADSTWWPGPACEVEGGCP
jgi:hypothetical protein